MRKIFVLFPAIFVFIGLLIISHGSPVSGSTSVVPPTLQPKTGGLKVDLNFGKFPLYFITNKGQVNKKAAFYAKASRYTLWLTKEGLVFDSVKTAGGKTDRDVSRMFFLNAKKNPEMISINETKHRVNYFKGNDPSKWNGDIPTSRAVLYKSLYKHIDLKVYGIEKQIEYDWIVKPGGNPSDIRFEYKNVKGTRLDENGNLFIETNFGELIHKRPVSYQENGNEKIEIKAGFKKIGKNTYGFKTGTYDSSQELIIDPVILAYSTYLGGGSNNYGTGIAVDDSGNAYVTGYTVSTDFPILNQYQTDPSDSIYDVFITKIDTTQSGAASLIYSTYLGGGNHDFSYGIAVDGSGNAYVTGQTDSTDFPTLNQHQADPGDPGPDAFVTKIDTTQSGAASLIYSTYLGGGDHDCGNAIAVDDSGDAYVSGFTHSTDFPTLNQYQTDKGYGDVFVTRIDTTQSGVSSLIYSTYLGGGDNDLGFGIAIDGSGNAYVIGDTISTDFPTLNQYQIDSGDLQEDAFVTKIDTTKSGVASLIYSTYLGGTMSDTGVGIAVDDSGNAYVTGTTYSTNFPTLNQYQTDNGTNDAFVTRIDTTQSGAASLIYSTYLGGTMSDAGVGIAVDDSGIAYVTGTTYSTNFPTLNHYQADPGDSNGDVFVTKLDTNRSGAPSLIYSTYLGGNIFESGRSIAVDSSGNAYVTGHTRSADFPTLNQYQATQSSLDVFVTKLVEAESPTVTTVEVSAVTTTSASGGGEVTSDGGTEVTARGVCWSTSLNPTTNDSHTTDGSGTGVFVSSITGLTPDKTYYVRAYAVNSAETAYGNEVSFTTSPISITVEFPNGGEQWQVNSLHNITWTGSGLGDYVGIEYSTDNGGNWTEITASTENDGTYPWTVPDAVSANCLVRVSEIDGEPSDTSDSVFSIVPNATWIPETERNILIALYNATNGDNWRHNNGWKEPPLYSDGFAMPGTEANWYGITISGPSEYHVTGISLWYNNLTGTIPTELGALGSLESLRMDFNHQISGNIPVELGNLSQLSLLNLQYNQLSGNIPTALGGLGNLSELNLADNLLNGSIPTELSNLGNLQTLNLSYNQLSGSIPPGLGNPGNLQTLNLSHNQLSGSIPPELGNLGNLQTLSLGSNQLNGSIPPELGNLSNLDYLSLSINQLSDTIPMELSNLSNLTTLTFAYNQLSGNIPAELGNLENLQSLYLIGNQLTGQIPAELGNLSNLKYLSLGENQLTGNIPGEIGNLGNLKSIYLKGNKLAGNIPSTLSNLTNLTTGQNIGYNALYTDDDNLRTFLNSKDDDWETTQTIAPTGVSATPELTDGTIEITWTPIAYTAESGGYRVFYGTEPGGPYTLFDTTADKTTASMTVTDLLPGETYYFILRTRTESHDNNANTVDSESSEEVSAIAPVPSITVISPNGGENLDAGSAHDITWTSEGNLNNVIIEYSTNNGGSWQTVVRSTENDGIYNWNVPTASSDKCLVRISGSTSDTGPADTSDAVFSIVSPDPGSITVRSPNGGESWAVGTPQTIEWNSTGDIGYVVIEYSRDNGTTWNKISQTTTNDGSYNWKIPNAVSDKCRVRVTSADGDADPVPSDKSDGVFSILRPTSPTLEVTAPNGGEQLVTGSRCAVTWYTTNTRGEAVIEYSTDNGDTWTEIAAVTDNDGEYDWIVPDTPSENCLLRVSETGGEPSDVSDGVFSIISPLSNDIVVISPNGGENWEAGSSKEIVWTAAGDINNVAIEFSTDNGFTWGNVVRTTGNDGSYGWTVPDTVSETCRVRVTAADTNMDPKPSDVSDEVFSIEFPSTPTIRVTAPNGGERLTVGSRFAVTWFATDSRTEAKIDYSINGGETWTEITGATENDGEYDWTIPEHSSETCLVRVSEADGQPVDISDAVFIITPPSSTEITVTAPNGGESCTAGTSEVIKWTFTGDITNVTIEHSTDNGITWEMVVETTANDGIFDWVVPEASSDTCLVRVTANDDDLDPKPSDVSDDVFSIVSSSPGDFRLTSPNGGESWDVFSTHAVTWSTSGNINNVTLEYSVDDGVTWSTIVSSTANGGTYDWSIPDDVSDKCRVRVTANDGGGDPRPSDESDSVFSIVRPSSPTIRVLTPNGGEQLVMGAGYEITWFATNSRAEAKIDYSMDGGETWTEIAGAVPNNGSYDWLVPEEPSEVCLIRVSEVDGEPVDISDAVFSIVSGQVGGLSVLTPNGGESIEVGSEYAITWECGDLNEVFIEYSVNDGATWTYIAAAAAGEGSYAWTVPGTVSDECRVRVSGAESDESPWDISDGVFSIVDSSQGTIEVLSPNGGDSLGVGEEYYITWSSSGFGNVLIEYSTDNGETWETIASVSAIGGRYTWIVPDTPSAGCLVRISGDDSPGDPSDVSDTLFSIVSN